MSLLLSDRRRRRGRGSDGVLGRPPSRHAAEARLQVAAQEAAWGSDPRRPRPRAVRHPAWPRHAAAQRPRPQRRVHQPEGEFLFRPSRLLSRFPASCSPSHVYWSRRSPLRLPIRRGGRLGFVMVPSPTDARLFLDDRIVAWPRGGS